MKIIEDKNYILFIDEAGKSKLSDIGDNFLLCGVVLNKSLHTALSSYMISLKKKNGIPSLTNVHAFDLFESEKLIANKIKKKQIDNFFEHFTHLITGSELQCFLYETSKAPFLSRVKKVAKSEKTTERAVNHYLVRNGVHDILYEILTAKIILDFGKFLEDRDAQGEVLVESRRQDDGAVMRGFMMATEGSNYRDNHYCEIHAKSSFERITTLSFQNKKGLSFGLEVADLFAWAECNNPSLIRSYKSRAKEERIKKRVKETIKIITQNKIKRPKRVNLSKTSIVGGSRVSKFINLLREYRNQN